jgi:hypothetical protein
MCTRDGMSLIDRPACICYGQNTRREKRETVWTGRKMRSEAIFTLPIVAVLILGPAIAAFATLRTIYVDDDAPGADNVDHEHQDRPRWREPISCGATAA